MTEIFYLVTLNQKRKLAINLAASMGPTLEDVDKLYGMDFDWFAQDVTGAIGLFCTSGYGEIPVEVLRHIEAHRAVADAIALPHWGTLAVWHDYAQVGLFVFDWQEWAGPYAKVTLPEGAMTMTLRKKIGQIPELPQLALWFSETASVKIDRFKPRPTV